MSEFGYIPESPAQSFGNNTGIFSPNDIYDLTRADKYTNYGQLELIQTIVSESNTNSIEFTDLKENEYNTHLFTFSNIKSAGAGQLHYNVYTSQYGYDTNGHYTSSLQRCSASGSFSDFRQVNVAFPYVQGHPLSSVSNQSMNAYWYFNNFGDSTKQSQAYGQTVSAHSSSLFNVSEYGLLNYHKPRPITKIKFKLGGGTIAFVDGSTISVYGIKFS